MRVMNINIGSTPKLFKSVRYSLAAVNSIFLIKGIILPILGVTYLVKHNVYDQLITNRFINLPAFTIATGVLILAIAVLGYYGAFSEKFYVVAGYAALMVVIFVFEMTITIIAFDLRNSSATAIRTPMVESMNLYEARRDIARLWDDLQMSFECCGVSGRHDWSNRIPISCCHIDYGTISPFQCNISNSYPTGCASALGGWFSTNAHVMGTFAAVFTSIQALLTAMSGWLAWRAKFEEVELES
ncbi:leukocyte surface antigen CD53-like [Pieris brassicae]|uniref:leukocyte surface antigen CD53-like n=1 Tax=Pieris brassicae TaxID=7116 RepID=UPI001E65F8F4|nr:leukocyte surface antigen CD53-like [Pieris brassicae]